MSLCVLPEAWEEGFAASDWYETQRAGLGDRFLSEVRQTFEGIERHPASYPRWESYLGHEEIRWASLGRFRYVVIFAVEGSEVVVLAISHAHRHPLYWSSRLA